tara:strand:+ start:52 stop:294 length:243 start_codon:yes stop_codon:yes gene_type:complete
MKYKESKTVTITEREYILINRGLRYVNTEYLNEQTKLSNKGALVSADRYDDYIKEVDALKEKLATSFINPITGATPRGMF